LATVTPIRSRAGRIWLYYADSSMIRNALYSIWSICCATASEFKERSIETFRTRRQLAEWVARAGHPETGLAELHYLQVDLAKFVEDGHPELTEVAAAIAELS
jgi:hypothetical protein